MMRKHFISMTYQPKIEPVQDGRCTQTIRTGRKFSVGDSILMHGWSGRPYRSPWGWRKRVTVTDILNILISEIGIHVDDGHIVYPWDDDMPNIWAKLDFIDPPTGEALRDILFGLNGAPDEPHEYQIIRWS